MTKTATQYNSAVKLCRDIFVKKMRDYGSAWRVLRNSSIVDQIFIKAQRIRTIEEKGIMKVEEDVRSEFIGIVNYSVIGLIQLHKHDDANIEMGADEGAALFDKFIGQARSLMENKNHDYGEAWRDMRVSSFTDLILMKLLRVRQIESNDGKTLVSEGIDANFFDMVNYAIFALIKLEE